MSGTRPPDGPATDNGDAGLPGINPGPSFAQLCDLIWRSLLRRRAIRAIICATAIGLVCAWTAWHQIDQSRLIAQTYYQYVGVRMGPHIRNGLGPPDPNQRGPEERRMWGLHEEKGWDRELYMSEKGLEPISGAERYRLYHNDTEAGTRAYFEELKQFAYQLYPSAPGQTLGSLYRHLPPDLRAQQSADFPATSSPDSLGPSGMINYKNIFQTAARQHPANSWYQRKWRDVNSVDGWRIRFFDDDDAATWTARHFGGTIVGQAYILLHRGVLKADMLRYMLLYLEGGVYTNTDTIPVRRIEHWGSDTVEYLDISSTDGPDFLAAMSTHPSVIVGIEFNIPKHAGWGWYRPRPVQMCQWTLAAAPGHPIYLDALRRIDNATQTAQEQWNHERERERIVSVIEWTPSCSQSLCLFDMYPFPLKRPGKYLQSRYRVSWHRLRGLSHPLRIGDDLILPSEAFSPGIHNNATDQHPQVAGRHQFAGSWKSKVDEDIV